MAFSLSESDFKRALMSTRDATCPRPPWAYPRPSDHFLRVHAQESLAAFGVAVPLADYQVDDAPMAAELEVLLFSPLA
jgi:hypothetical protein